MWDSKKKFCCASALFLLFLIYIVIYGREQLPLIKASFFPKGPLNNCDNPVFNLNDAVSRPFMILFWTDWYGGPAERLGPELYPLCKDIIITSDKSKYEIADVIAFQFVDIMRAEDFVLPKTRKPDQPWILASQEATVHYSLFKINQKRPNGLFNWTWSTRGDSTIYTRFTDAFEKFKEKDDKWTYGSDFSLEFLRNKTKLGAWTVSNCGIQPSQRNSLIDNLKNNGIPVDIYGKCGSNKCEGYCFATLGLSYKFYFALENALCHEYITEKIYHGLLNGMVPVVYALGDLTRVAPNNSYINVFDYSSVKDLAEYLKYLDKNATEYFKYFEWRKEWNISTETVKYQCEIPSKMRAYVQDLKINKEKSKYRHVYENLDEWYYTFYNPNFKKFCDVCLASDIIDTTVPMKNEWNMYNDSTRCEYNTTFS